MPADDIQKTATGAVQNGTPKNGRQEAPCPVCGVALAAGAAFCGKCGWLRPAPAPERLKPTPLLPREYSLVAQFDRLLVLAAILAFTSLYLPWLPGINGSVPGWNVPYSALDVPLDEIRRIEEVKRPESLFLLNAVGFLALLFCRTSRHAGLRDQAACVLLVNGGGYILLYFAHEWGWCLLYNYAGPYLAFLALGLVVLAGLLRTKFMPWIAQSRVYLMLASAFLLTGFFLPWSLDHSGAHLMVVAQQFYWLGIPRAYAYPMIIFPILGFVGFIAAFCQIPRATHFIVRVWPLWVGVAALIYFRYVWVTYLAGVPLGSWGTLAGLTLLSSAGIMDIWPTRPALGRFAVWVFLAVSLGAWLSGFEGGLAGIMAKLSNVPPPVMF